MRIVCFHTFLCFCVVIPFPKLALCLPIFYFPNGLLTLSNKFWVQELMVNINSNFETILKLFMTTCSNDTRVVIHIFEKISL